MAGSRTSAALKSVVRAAFHFVLFILFVFSNYLKSIFCLDVSTIFQFCFGGFTEVQVAIQNFLIVIEMFIVAILHKYVFSHVEYQDGSLMIIMNARKAAWKEAENPNSYAQAAQAMKVKQDLLNIKEQANEVVAEIKLSVDQAVLNAGESVIDNTTPEQKLALLALSMQANDALAVVDDKLVTLQQAVSAELMKKDSERFLNEEDDDVRDYVD
jgi:hypothetical protein